MPPLVYPPFSSAVVLCLDDNPDVLECEREFLETFQPTVAYDRLLARLRTDLSAFL
jgi:hypothetical protein